MNYISGGVTAAIGFKASGLHCGVKNDLTDKKDIAMILSERECSAAGVFTLNQVKAAPIYVTKDHLRDGKLRGVIVNSGNANACAPQGKENALRMTYAAAAATNLDPKDFAVASTGVIGQTIRIDAIEAGIPALAATLSKDGSTDAANAILTTDTYVKEVALTIEIAGTAVTIGAIAKGSGMIHPNMGTMLCFVTTDCDIASTLLQAALESTIKKTFNRITVDGDTSTNDTCVVLANGMAKNKRIDSEGAAYDVFTQALRTVLEEEAKLVAGDGEGAGRLIACTVEGAESEEKAELMAKSVVASSLVKAAMFGTDANWGRVLCAIGYSGATFDPEKIAVKFFSNSGEVLVCQEGAGVEFDEEQAKRVLTEKEVNILVTMQESDAKATCWGCDLTYDYVKINGDYRS
ncbi:MAG: bifunctional glutamate N-acetyltransferase/amino-acid acetyltransferase ArgJ [Evtepia sp.]